MGHRFCEQNVEFAKTDCFLFPCWQPEKERETTSWLLSTATPMSWIRGTTVDSGRGAWPDLLEGQHRAVLAFWEANRSAPEQQFAGPQIDQALPLYLLLWRHPLFQLIGMPRIVLRCVKI